MQLLFSSDFSCSLCSRCVWGRAGVCAVALKPSHAQSLLKAHYTFSMLPRVCLGGL